MGTVESIPAEYRGKPATGYVASAGNATAGDNQNAKRTASAGTKGSINFLQSDSLKELGGGELKRYIPKNVVNKALGKEEEAGNEDKCAVAYVFKVFIDSMDKCPRGLRRLTLVEVQRMKDELVLLLDEWDIIKVAGGKIGGSGYGNVITPGQFDNGWGWVFLTPSGFSYYDKIFIESLDIATGWRRLTVEEARPGPIADKICKSLDEWDIVKLAGGKTEGPGYGCKLHEGYFDNGVGWVIVVSE